MQKIGQKAFTLIELMIVVAIIGILSSIAYPSYQEQIRTTKEAEAKAALVSFASAMSQYYFDGMTYVGATTGIFKDQVPVDGGAKTYTLSIVGIPTIKTFKLKAVPVDSGAKTFCIDEKGTKDDCSGTHNW